MVASPSSPGVSQLLEAEKRADDIALRAREEADRIVADARKRAEQITGGEGAEAGGSREAAQVREEADAEKTRIARDTREHIERVQKSAGNRRADALERLVKTLFGQS
jgi:vacuolar-type H+-ATPase subunit H